MISRVFGAALSGIDPFIVTVETDVQRGLPKFDIVGLAQGAVQEGKNRIASALRSSGVAWGPKRITVNLAPAAVRKEGAALDLPIALGLAVALEIIPPQVLEGKIALGELSLDGALQPLRGVYAVADFAHENGWKSLVVPRANAHEAVMAGGLSVIAPADFSELLSCLRGERTSPPPEPPASSAEKEEVPDWSDVGGQRTAKRAMEIAAAGNHNLLLTGPPGIGKTFLARRLPTILPGLEEKEFREVRRVHSAAGHDLSDGTAETAPFRAPHHNASIGGMLGGGRPFRPGEFTLAHRGVLFFDELPEFRRDVIEALREPLEEGAITVSRAERVIRLPAKFLFLGAMNLCPCGALGDAKRLCGCTPPAVDRYRNKVSGPVRDRIDMIVSLQRPLWKEVWRIEGNEKSAAVKARVEEARERQRKRCGGIPVWNAFLPAKQLRERSAIDGEGESLLAAAADKLGFSARGIDKALRVARTIADLEGSPRVRAPHIAEALQYRVWPENT